jgi:hypothetical protein
MQMRNKKESPQAAACEALNQSPINNQKPVTDKTTPQARKEEKIVQRVEDLTGITFPFVFASMVHDAVRTGLRVTDKEEEENYGYPVHCNAEYHFARMTGPGSDLVPLLYGVSMHVGYESKNFWVTLQPLARFLGVKEETLYAAADLLVASGFWEVIERSPNKATKYRPLGHKDWAHKCGTIEWNGEPVGKHCAVKAAFPFKEDSAEYELGQKLYGITGEKYYKGVLTGWLKLAPVPELLSWAKDFMVGDAGAGTGIQRRIRLSKHLHKCASRIVSI